MTWICATEQSKSAKSSAFGRCIYETHTYILKKARSPSVDVSSCVRTLFTCWRMDCSIARANTMLMLYVQCVVESAWERSSSVSSVVNKSVWVRQSEGRFRVGYNIYSTVNHFELSIGRVSTPTKEQQPKWTANFTTSKKFYAAKFLTENCFTASNG